MARIKKIKEETNADRLARYGRIVQSFGRAGLPTTQISIGKSLKPKIGQGAVSAWKRVNPSIGHLCQIARLTGVNGHWLLLGDGPIEQTVQCLEIESVLQRMIDQLPADAQAAIADRVRSKRRKSK